jgi:ATPase family associated with various cellular activities (AAA)
VRADRRAADAAPCLRTVALGLLARALPAADGEPERPEERFLRALAWDAEPLDGLDACLLAPAPDDRRLVALAGELGLTRLELVATALARAVEDDPLVGRAIADLQAPLAGSRPCLGLLAQVLAPLGEGELSPLLRLVGGRAVATGVLELGEAELPLPERTLRLPDALGLALAGTIPDLPGIEVLDRPAPGLPESLRFEARRLAALLQRSADRVVAVRAGSSAEARQAAHAIAAALGRAAALIDPARLPGGLGPLCRLLGWLPVLRLRLGPGERQTVPRLAGYDGPRLALLGPDGQLEDAGELLDWTVPLPTAAERTALWRRELQDAALAEHLGRTQLQGSTRIRAVGRRACLNAELAGRPAPCADAVREAALAEARGGLDALAQPIADHVPDAALVVPERLQAELALLGQRCCRREGLAAGLGAALQVRYRLGVRALLTGPSGTGKTLACAWLATRLGLPLYRVDLAAVTSKYIGETEKNLAELLARAEAADVVLLFDEADSLFGKRTEVKDANDRFANSQTNYLLQRIETYGGIVLLTSNSRGRLDPAFTRRLDMIVEFPLPGPKERRGLWRAHLGSAHSLDQADLNRLAASCTLAGGDIRNVVLIAAVRAKSEDRPIRFADIREGLAIEYRKLAKALPPELAG